MKIGIVASELYAGGETTWTTVLIKSLLLLDEVDSINLYSNKDYALFAETFGAERRLRVHKVSWAFRFGIASFPALWNAIIRYSGAVSSVLMRSLYGLNRINDENDIVLFPYVAAEAAHCTVPYIITPHDLRRKRCALTEPRTIHFFTHFRAQLGDALYRRLIARARFIIVESDYVKRDILEFYKIDAGRIRKLVSPVLVGSTAGIAPSGGIAAKYALPDSFILYPAHFIKLKNHIALIRALDRIRLRYGVIIPAVFVGKEADYYDTVVSAVRDSGLREAVHVYGYVSSEDLQVFYSLARLVVIPTLFESVSMPIWEAFHLGVPVASSNVCALPDQVGDAGMLFDPFNIDEMAEKIYCLWTNVSLRKHFIKKGLEKVNGLTLENYAQQLKTLLEGCENDF